MNRHQRRAHLTRGTWLRILVQARNSVARELKPTQKRGRLVVCWDDPNSRGRGVRAPHAAIALLAGHNVHQLIWHHDHFLDRLAFEERFHLFARQGRRFQFLRAAVFQQRRGNGMDSRSPSTSGPFRTPTRCHSSSVCNSRRTRGLMASS